MSLERIGEIFTINQEETMEKVKNHVMRIWNLAITNKKATAVVLAIIVVLILLQK